MTVESEDKKRSRINVIHDILQRIPWSYVEPKKIEIPERPSRTDTDTEHSRPDRADFQYAEDVAANLERDRVRERKKTDDKKTDDKKAKK